VGVNLWSAAARLDRRVLGASVVIRLRDRRWLLRDAVAGRPLDPEMVHRGWLWVEHTLDHHQARRMWRAALATFGFFAIVGLALLFTSHGADGTLLLTLAPVTLLSPLLGQFLARQEAEDLRRVLPSDPPHQNRETATKSAK
jgi:hypothetical protein